MGVVNSRLKEVINRNIVVSLALEQGFNAYLPVYDEGIDFILYRESDRALRKVQLKSRWTIDRKYLGRDIWIAFPAAHAWYLAPHDKLVEKAPSSFLQSKSWAAGSYSTAAPSSDLLRALDAYRLNAIELLVEDATSEAREVSASQEFTVWDELRSIRDMNPAQSLSVAEILDLRDQGRAR